jgi:N-acetylmuramoyl-L-alanine amidase
MTTTPTPPSPSHPLAQLKSSGRLLATVASVAILVATLLTLWTPTALLSNTFSERINTVLRPEQATPTTPAVIVAPAPVLPIGIVAGHTGNPPDSGAVCPDGLREVDVNAKIATLVRQNLVNLGYKVDLLTEWDTRLRLYKAQVLVSIHNDSCQYINNEATGFKVAAARASANDPAATRLTNCLIDRYGRITGLPFHYNSITPDMTSYHAFDEISTSTPAAIIEAGFLNLDRNFLTQKTDVVAQGITAGILCFINNEPVQPTPAPTTQTTP